MNKFFTTNDLDSLVFYQVPKVLILGDRYKSMKPNALKLYMVLFDRMKLSLQNGWKDDQGRYYVRMSQDGASELFDWSPTTFRAMKKELEKFGLLVQDREGQGKSNKLYVLKCDYDEADVYKINKSVDMEMEENEKKAQIIDSEQKNNFCSSEENEQKDNFCSSRRTTFNLLEGQLLASNNNNINNNNFNNNEELIVNKESVNKNNENIANKLINEYRLKGLNKDVCLRVLEEVKATSDVENFGGYFRTCLETTLYRVKVKTGEIDPIQRRKEATANSQVPFYDWLNGYPDDVD